MIFDVLKSEKPILIDGGSHFDERGGLYFVNDASLDGVKRFYLISNKTTNVVRAWQAHKIERKYFYATEGSFLIGAVKLDSFENPSPDLKGERFLLHADAPHILMIPLGYANGIRALTDRNKLLVFSTLDVQQSGADSYRFPSQLWLDWSVDESIS